MRSPTRPLLLSTDEPLTDEMLRLAAVGGVPLEVAIDPGAVRTRYMGAPLVLVGDDLAEAVVRARLPRRGGVVVVSLEAGEHLLVQAQRLGAEFVASLPTAQPWLLDRLASATALDTRVARILGVVGGRGGAGASTLAVALAVTAVRAEQHTLLIDADPRGGGIDLTLGLEHEEGLRWPDFAGASGRIDPGVLTDALPKHGLLAVLSWGRDAVAEAPMAAMRAALAAGRRGVDVVVIDLPRCVDEAAAIGIGAADRVYVVVPAELRATSSAVVTIREVGDHTDRLGAVVRGPSPGGLRADEVASAVGLPLLGEFPTVPGLPGAVERGYAPAGSGRGPIAALCRALLAAEGGA
jgi:secretion/DNA translocation related CpaE-like protein